jgi:hypothetical protein
MTRNDFVRKLIRVGLLVLLALIVFVLKERIVPGENCSGCPGNGICSGKKDCQKY